MQALALLALLAAPAAPEPQATEPQATGPRGTGPAAPELAGRYRAWLDSPGGELPFELEVERTAAGLAARVRNGSERIDVPRVTWSDGELGLHFDHFDSRVVARLDPATGVLGGTWTKRRGPDTWTEMAFHAAPGDAPRFPEPPGGAAPGAFPLPAAPEHARWRAAFESAEDPAVLLLQRSAAGPHAVEGTFLTTTGDYRFLAGSLHGAELALSCFDGAHAFLFRARWDGSRLAGDFWSRDTWHETWSAVPDAEAALPDPFAATAWDPEAALADLVFPDLEGRPRSLADPAFGGRARLLQVFGSWCPNCYDETRYLVELHERYASRGLSIVGLAFELTGDFERDAEQVRVYREHHSIPYPLLVAGLSDKDKASAAFPALDRVRSYPTTIFMDEAGAVHRVHTGFSGPGTGAAHRELRREFEEAIEALLERPAARHDEAWEWLSSSTWVERGVFTGRAYRFHTGPDGGRLVTVESHGRQGVTGSETRPVSFQPGAVALGDELWRLDRRAGVLRSPFDAARRLSPDARTSTPLLARLGLEGEEDLVRALDHEDPVVRREAVHALAEWRRSHHRTGLAEALPLLDAPALAVRTAAARAMGLALEARAADGLLACLDHPNAALRRAAAASLAELARIDAELAGRWAHRPPDPDPLVRAALGRAGR